MIIKISSCYLHVKAWTFTVYTDRPDKLAYHDRCFHVMDMKVFTINIMLSYSMEILQMCQCLEIGFGSVSEVISSQVHQLNCTKEVALFHTTDMLVKLCFLNPSHKNSICTAPYDDKTDQIGFDSAFDFKENDDYKAPAARKSVGNAKVHAENDSGDDHSASTFREKCGDDTVHTAKEKK